MSKNLLELLNAHLTEDVVSKIASFIGESPKKTGSALGSALPSLLSGLVHKSEDSQGAGILYNLLTQNYDSSLLSNLGAELLGGDVTAKLASAGGGLLSSLFGSKLDGIADVVASSSGVNKTASTSLLGLLMPIIFAVLGKTLKSEQITSPAGLTSLLRGQSGFLKDLIPTGLASILGIGAAAAASMHSAAGSATAHVVDIEKRNPTPLPLAEAEEDHVEPYVAPIVRERKIIPPPAPISDDDDAGIFGKLLPWLIFGSILALGWGIWKNLKKATDTAPPVAVVESPSAGLDATPPVPTASTSAASVTESAPVATPAPAEVASSEPTSSTPTTAENTSTTASGFQQKLSSGFELKAPANSMESKLFAFINDADAKIDKNKWFTMDGLTFDTGKASLKAESGMQMTNITEILKAFPKVKLKVGGYTDNTGNAKSNKKLSADRANTVTSTLIKAGIDKARVEGEGFGSAHPVASNDTAEGRQQNRRIDVRVTAK